MLLQLYDNSLSHGYSLEAPHEGMPSNIFLGRKEKFTYCNDLKFLDRKVLANSADSEQTSPRGAV